MKSVKALAALALALTVSTGILAGCSKPQPAATGGDKPADKASDKPVEITWWNYPNYDTIDNTPGKYEQQIIANFNKKYPNIKVNVEMIDFNSGPQKLNTAIASNSAPDLVYDYPGRIIDYARNGVMAPLDDMFNDAFKKDVPATILDACKLDNKYYMYPLNTAPFMMAFNKTMLEKAGIANMLPLDKPDRLWTIDEMTALLKAIKEKIPGVAPMTVFAKSSGGDQATRALISNIYGGSTVSKDLKQYTLNSPEAVKGLEWVVNGVKEGLIAKGAEALTSNDAIDMYLQGKTASTIIYSTVLKKTNASKKIGNFDEVLIPFPTSNTSVKPQLEAFVGGIGIFDNKNPDKIAAAKKLVDFIANDPDSFKNNLKSTGGLSVKQSVTGLYDDKEAKYAEGMVKYVGTYYNAVPGFTEMRTFWFPMLQKVLLGSSSAKDGLDDFVKKANETLTKK
jgi:multiple sugar transport system substrate-binding protein